MQSGFGEIRMLLNIPLEIVEELPDLV